MSNKPFKFVLACAAGLLAASCVQGTTTERIPSSDKILVVDLHTWMPTGSSTDADLVSITATQDIADEFKELTGITIKWFTGKTLDGEAEEVSADYIKAIQNGTMPAIGFSWSAFTDRGYYMDLSEAMNTANEFLTAEEQASYPTWKDQFPSYLWSKKETVDSEGKIIAVPLTLNPGPATGWFYNKTKFEAQGYSIPTTWNEFRTLCSEIQSDTEAGPYPYKQTISLDNWEFKFSVGPSFAKLLMDQTDADGNGTVSEKERMTGVKNGLFSPLREENPNNYQIAQAAYYTIKDFYTNMLPSNWKTAQSATAWSNGKALLRENGLWAIRAERGNDSTRDWKYGIFPMPLVGKDSKSFLEGKGLGVAAGKVSDNASLKLDSSEEYTNLSRAEAFVEMYHPDPSLYVNLMYNGVYHNDTVKSNAIKFLKFLSTPENVSKLIVDHQATLGGVKGAVPGASVSEWLMSSFPAQPDCEWPTAVALSDKVSINQQLSKWVNGALDDATFFSNVASIQKEAAKSYFGE